jgi:hypothetical protein
MATRSRGGRPPDSRATGQVLAYRRKDGLTSWYLRVRAYGGRHRINLGTELDGWTEAESEDPAGARTHGRQTHHAARVACERPRAVEHP